MPPEDLSQRDLHDFGHFDQAFLDLAGYIRHHPLGDLLILFLFQVLIEICPDPFADPAHAGLKIAAGQELAHGKGQVGSDQHVLHFIGAQQEHQQGDHAAGNNPRDAAGDQGNTAAAAQEADEQCDNGIDHPGDLFDREH